MSVESGHVGGAPLGGEVGEALLPRRQAGLVVVERGEVHGDVDALAGLAVDEPQVALERRVQLVGRQDVEHDQLRAGRGELADDPVRGRVEQVRDAGRRRPRP